MLISSRSQLQARATANRIETEPSVTTFRQQAIAGVLRATLPHAPYFDAQAIRTAAGARHMRGLSPDAAVWLAALAHIRHVHTDYDLLRDEGYEKEEAFFLILDEVNALLDRWGSRRHALAEEDPK